MKNLDIVLYLHSMRKLTTLFSMLLSEKQQKVASSLSKLIVRESSSLSESGVSDDDKAKQEDFD